MKTTKEVTIRRCDNCEKDILGYTMQIQVRRRYTEGPFQGWAEWDFCSFNCIVEWAAKVE